MRTRKESREALPPTSAASGPVPRHPLLSLQRAAGNRAVVTLMRQVAPAPEEPEGKPGARPNLGLGDRGPGVKLLQAKLTEHGYPTARTGTFTAGTLTRVKEFQQDRPHLHPVTGGVGRGTWAALDSAPMPETDIEPDDSMVEITVIAAFKRTGKGVTIEHLYAAWGDLKLRRDTEPPDAVPDPNLAAAEHYLWARIEAFVIHEEGAKLTALAYTAAKAIGIVPRLGTGKTTPASLFQLRWELRGSHDGDIANPPDTHHINLNAMEERSGKGH
ncbi:hypothetical protein Afil01_43880 [Actinorhabdospora filicis]|uniref:Peptidoglycan binding-like domain-containing protein n=1 Tax=Actinorhabdospora filicis TaxID=1785913 RepID=A0A9W6WBH7_9ACTN|nr:peptidoglycan-binding protein [Actinorhabdospora filicis]GLZ79581.1 hypothetical protein Afil01_43880 [Actinorhabdospora filicis]